MGLENLIKLPKSGDAVTAGSVNLPFRTLDQNVKYIWEVIQSLGLGSTIFLRRQSIEATTKVGTPVWRNPVTSRFEKGLALTSTDQATGVVTTHPSSQIWGVITRKLSATLGDICLLGVVPIDLSEVVDGDVVDGTYYLSNTNPGKLVIQKPPVTVSVLRYAAGQAYVQPQWVDFLDRHQHYRFSLTCQPAGQVIPPDVGERHVITDPDTALPGWLPADHSVFNGKAPAGAVFGYNLDMDPALKAAWPPVPITSIYLELDRGLVAVNGLDQRLQTFGGMSVPLGPSGLCIIDVNGLWWMSDCYADVPWPADFRLGLSDSTSSSGTPECPRQTTMTLTAYMTKPTLIGDTTAVTSLRSGDTRIKVKCYTDNTRDGTTGDLELFLDLQLGVTPGTDGYTALKSFDPDTNLFSVGPVVEGFYALSSNVNLTGSTSGIRSISGTNRRVYQGLVGVTVDPADTKELDVQLVRLDGAEEGYFDDPPLMYLAFNNDMARAYRGKLQVPDDLAITSPELKLRFTVLGRAAGTLPQLTFTGRIVPRASDGLNTPMDLPTSSEEFSITCDTVATLDDSNQYVEAESEPFSIAPGDTVYFTVQREDGDGYAAELGILRHLGVVVSGA